MNGLREKPLRVGEAAGRLGVGAATLRRWTAAGYVKSVRSPGGQRWFEVDEIERVRQGMTDRQA